MKSVVIRGYFSYTYASSSQRDVPHKSVEIFSFTYFPQLFTDVL